MLYADDSSVARLQIESVLTRLGLPFVSTKTGKEAWERLKTLSHEARNAGIPLGQKVAMVLTDLEMPEMDGFTLTRHIKEDDALKGLPVIIHSSCPAPPTNLMRAALEPTATSPSSFPMNWHAKSARY